MESNIATKIKMLNFEQDKYPMLNKFMICLSDSLITVEQAEQIITYLNSKGIVLTKPSQQNIMTNGFDFIKNQVEKMESLGAIGAYIEDPSRINSKNAPYRVEYLQSIGEPIMNAEGKYSKMMFRKRAFETKFGTEYLNKKEKNQEMVADSYESKEPEIENDVIDVQVPTWNEPVTSFEQVSEQVIAQPLVETYQEIGAVNYDDPEMVSESLDPLCEILNKPQTIGLNDETFERYEKLAESIRHVLVSVYGIEEINDSITDNLIKLITHDVMDDSTVMYYAITYGKNITDEEVKRLKNAISEELEYTSILDLDMRLTA